MFDLFIGGSIYLLHSFTTNQFRIMFCIWTHCTSTYADQVLSLISSNYVQISIVFQSCPSAASACFTLGHKPKTNNVPYLKIRHANLNIPMCSTKTFLTN